MRFYTRPTPHTETLATIRRIYSPAVDDLLAQLAAADPTGTRCEATLANLDRLRLLERSALALHLDAIYDRERRALIDSMTDADLLGWAMLTDDTEERKMLMNEAAARAAAAGYEVEVPAEGERCYRAEDHAAYRDRVADFLRNR